MHADIQVHSVTSNASRQTDIKADRTEVGRDYHADVRDHRLRNEQGQNRKTKQTERSRS